MFGLRKALSSAITEQIEQLTTNQMIISSGLRFLLGGTKDKREVLLSHKLDSIRQTGEALAKIDKGASFAVNIDTIIYNVTRGQDGRFSVTEDKVNF